MAVISEIHVCFVKYSWYYAIQILLKGSCEAPDIEVFTRNVIWGVLPALTIEELMHQIVKVKPSLMYNISVYHFFER